MMKQIAELRFSTFIQADDFSVEHDLTIGEQFSGD
jgi:hypothetical protein